MMSRTPTYGRLLCPMSRSSFTRTFFSNSPAEVALVLNALGEAIDRKHRCVETVLGGLDLPLDGRRGFLRRAIFCFKMLPRLGARWLAVRHQHRLRLTHGKHRTVSPFADVGPAGRRGSCGN